MSLHPFYLPRRHRREEAENHGYSPSADDNLPPAQHLRAPEGTDRLAIFAAQVEAVRATFDKEDS